MICNEIWSKKTFTLSELRTEVSHENSIISKDEALERINFYLDVLGEEKANADELKLIKDYQVYKVCWMVDRGNVIIKINSEDGELVSYDCFYDNEILSRTSIEELYKNLNLPNDFEICENKFEMNSKNIIYSRKYGDIYNFNQSVRFVINDNKITAITVFNYSYEDSTIVVSKEEALKIAEENNIKVDTIELSIEKISDLTEDLEGYKFYKVINSDEWQDIELFNKGIKVKKVWRIIGDNKTILVDVKTGEIINNK